MPSCLVMEVAHSSPLYHPPLSTLRDTKSFRLPLYLRRRANQRRLLLLRIRQIRYSHRGMQNGSDRSSVCVDKSSSCGLCRCLGRGSILLWCSIYIGTLRAGYDQGISSRAIFHVG